MQIELRPAEPKPAEPRPAEPLQSEPEPREPWMRGTWTELDPLRRGVVHALELCEEEAERWAASLTDEQMFFQPLGLPSVAFHLRHMVRSLDRLLTYAANGSLSATQLTLLSTETETTTAADVLHEFREGLRRGKERVRACSPDSYAEPRGIGRRRLPTTVGGLLVHCAEHSQRHAGQMVTTAKVVSGECASPAR